MWKVVPVVASVSGKLGLWSLEALLPSLLAVCFGIAKGFNLQEQTSAWVRKGLESQPEVAETLIGFADKQLQNTKGGLIAGIGVQASEFAKPAFVVFVAWLFAESARRPEMPATSMA